MEARVGNLDSKAVSQVWIPFFFKQWGGVHKAAAGRKLDGRTYDEMPSPVAAGTGLL